MRLLLACAAVVFCALEFSACAQNTPANPWDPADNFFPIMPWELGKPDKLADPHQGIESLKECGFTTVGFVRPQHLPTCEKLGMRAIVCKEKWQTDWAKLSDEQIEQTVASLVREAGKSPALIGYFLKDEPGVQDFPALAVTALIDQHDVANMAITHEVPDHPFERGDVGEARTARKMERRMQSTVALYSMTAREQLPSEFRRSGSPSRKKSPT